MNRSLKFCSFAHPLDYPPIFENMRHFTRTRDANTQDEIWFLEHTPVFTQGQAGKQEHLLAPGNIPVVQSDRGGQVTYHGPGQLMIYSLIDLGRLRLGVREFVCLFEKSLIALLGVYGIAAYSQAKAPGVYIEKTGAKIASLGIRIRKGCCYHGASFNISLDLNPFKRINPCGFKQLTMARLIDYVPSITRHEVEQQLKKILIGRLALSKTTL